MRAALSRALFSLARRPIVHAAVRLGFARLAWAIPVRRVHESASALAFHHPRPSWPTHVLVVPKRAVPSLLALDDLGLLEEIVAVARAAATRLGLAAQPCTLLVNGGAWQDVGQLHFHLIAGQPDLYFGTPAGAGDPYPHPEPARATHLVVPGAGAGAFAVARDLVRQRVPAGQGFALALCAPGLRDPAGLHLISGPRLQAASP